MLRAPESRVLFLRLSYAVNAGRRREDIFDSIHQPLHESGGYSCTIDITSDLASTVPLCSIFATPLFRKQIPEELNRKLCR